MPLSEVMLGWWGGRNGQKEDRDSVLLVEASKR